MGNAELQVPEAREVVKRKGGMWRWVLRGFRAWRAGKSATDWPGRVRLWLVPEGRRRRTQAGGGYFSGTVSLHEESGLAGIEGACSQDIFKSSAKVALKLVNAVRFLHVAPLRFERAQFLHVLAGEISYDKHGGFAAAVELDDDFGQLKAAKIGEEKIQDDQVGLQLWERGFELGQQVSAGGEVMEE